MSILNALPASMTLAPLNDANNGRQGAEGEGAAATCMDTPLSTSAAPSQLILPHYATLNALNIFEH